MATPWQELEIEPTADVLAIRRAYRARLGRTRPEDAARLQAAYEGAIASLPLATAPVPTAAPAQGTAGIAAALAARDPAGAAGLIASGRADGTLRLRDDIELSEQLLALLTLDPATPSGAVRQAASLVGWLAGDAVPAGAAFDRLRARLAADTWLASVDLAAARTGLFDSEATAARHLLGLERSLIGRAVPPRTALASLLADLDRHRPWLDGRLDPAHVAEARRLAGLVDPSTA